MRITESRLRQIIQEVMSEVEEQEPSYASYSADLVAAHGSEGPYDYRRKVAAVLRKMPDNYAALLKIALEDPAAAAAAGSVEKDTGKILGALMAADALDLDDVVAIGSMLSAPAAKITESKLRQIIREELIRETVYVNGKEYNLYRSLDEDAQELAKKLTEMVHGPGYKPIGWTGVDWKLEEKPYTNSGEYFTHYEVSLKNVLGPDVKWVSLGKGANQREALEAAIKNYPGVRQRLTGRLTFTKKS